MEKIVILTGSFNPPTLAHFNSAVKAMELVGADRGYLVPTSYDYLKEKMLRAGDGFVLSDEIRDKMVKVLCREDNRLVLGAPESENGTHSTIARIAEKHPGAQLYYVAGADKLSSLPHWQNAERLLSSTKIIVFERGDKAAEKLINKDKLLKGFKDSFIIVPELDGVSDISSTKVRTLFRNHDRSYREFLLPGVADILDGLDPDDYQDPDFADTIRALRKNGRYGEQKAMKLVYQANMQIFKQLQGNERTAHDTQVYDSRISAGNVPAAADILHTGCVNSDVSDAALMLKAGGYNPAILSNANRVTACGGYHRGDNRITEDELCRCSNLSQSLYQFGNQKLKGVKESGVKNRGCAYPLDIRFGGIYSPDVVFFRKGRRMDYAMREESFTCSVVSVPSLTNSRRKNENKIILEERKYFNTDGTLTGEGIDIMKDKIRTALRIALLNGHDSMVIGDFGVAHGGIDASELAAIFDAVIREHEFEGKFRAIAFAFDEGKGSKSYPVGAEGKYGAFYRTFGSY